MFSLQNSSKSPIALTGVNDDTKTSYKKTSSAVLVSSLYHGVLKRDQQTIQARTRVLNVFRSVFSFSRVPAILVSPSQNVTEYYFFCVKKQQFFVSLGQFTVHILTST